MKIRNEDVSNFHLKEFDGRMAGYYITRGDTGIEVVRGRIYYPLAIRLQGRTFYVDHLPTGHFMLRFKKLSLAKAFVKHLLALDYDELNAAYVEDVATERVKEFVSGWH